MYSRFSFANFIISYYTKLHYDCKNIPQRKRLSILDILYYLGSASYTVRACIWAFCYNTNYCSVSLSGSATERLIPLLWDNNTVLVLSEYSIYQAALIGEYFMLDRIHEFAPREFQNVFHVLIAIKSYTFKQSLLYDTRKIYLNNVPFGNDHYREGLWMICVLMNFISKFFFCLGLAIVILLDGLFLSLLFESLTLIEFIILAVDISVLSLFFLSVVMTGFYMGCLAIKFATTGIINMMNDQVTRTECFYRRMTSSFLPEMDRTTRMYSHLLNQESSADCKFVKHLYTFLVIFSINYNAFSIAYFVNDNSTLTVLVHLLVGNGCLYLCLIASAELLLITSNVLLKPRRVFLNLLASKHAKTIGLYRLLKYANFLHIVHHKRPFRFHFSLFSITHKSILSLVLCFCSAVLFIVRHRRL